jgi:competence protein ComEC
LTRPDPLLARPYWASWMTSMERPLAWLIYVFSGSVAAWLGLLPLMAVYFHLFTPVSVLANVLVIPVLGGITALGMLAMPVHAVWPWLTLTLNNANFFLLGLMIRGVDWLGRIPYGHWFVQAPAPWLVAGYYAAVLVLLSRRLTRRHKLWVCAVAVPALGVVMLVRGWRAAAVEITVLDLDQGVAVFLDVPGERHDWLIDGGDRHSGRSVENFLRHQGVDRLGAVVLTGGDKGRVAGLSTVTRKIPVAQAIDSGAAVNSPSHRQWLVEIRRQSIPLRRLAAGEEIRLGEDVRVRALYPPADGATGRRRDEVLVLAVQYGPTRTLLTSDAGAAVERALLVARTDLRADLLVKGRHATEPSATREFRAAVQPRAVVITGERRPGIRYPEPELTEWLERHGGRLYRTAEQGAVTIRLTARGWSIRTCGEAR